MSLVLLTNEYMKRASALAVPGAYWSAELKHFVVDNPTPRAARAAITMFPQVLVDNEALAKVAESDYGVGARPVNFADELGLRLDVGPLGPHHLYDWQDTDAGYLAAIAKRDGGMFVGWDRGLGKTTVAAAFIKAFEAERSLIVCRNDTKESVWYRQLKEDPGLLPDHRVVIIPNPKVKRERMLDSIANGDFDTGDPWVFVIHYQAIPLIAGEKIVKHKGGNTTFRKGAGDGWKALGRWDYEAYDESHRLANYNPNSPKNPQFGRGLAQMRKQVDIATNLTGSFLNNRAEGMFGQLHHILPKTYRAKWADFNDRFIDYLNVDARRVAIGFQVDRLPELRRELGVFTVYRKKSEVFDLPPLIHQNIDTAMLPDQAKAYNDMRDKAWTQIDEKGVVAANPMALMHTLRRVATAWPGLESAKLDYCINELEASPDDQFAIFTWYKEPGHLLAERLGDSCIVVDGDVAPKHRPELLRRHEDGKARVLIGSIATLGESLNLQYMHEAIRLDRDWDPEVNGQTIDRLHRHGQETRVTLHDLWTPHTVDTLKVKPNLRSKEMLRKALFA